MSRQPLDQLLDETMQSLLRMQSFDVNLLPQEEKLGQALNFSEAPAPAKRLIDLYRLISPEVLKELPQALLQTIKNRANEDYSHLNAILTFTIGQVNPEERRNMLVGQIASAYAPAFESLYQLISWSAARTTDFKTLESDARAAAQDMRDRTRQLIDDLEAKHRAAEEALGEIRKVAAEQGVSQQAIHFKTEADAHHDQARKWLWGTVSCGVVLLLWAVGSLFIHKISIISPTSSYEGFQLALSKSLIFGVLSFATYLSARNFLSHTHNAIVNKHRQNALVTYRALVEAAGVKGNSDIVLTHAAACIYAPQTTGYTSGRPLDGATAKSVVEVLGRPLSIAE